MKNNTNANVNGKQHDRKTNEEDRRLGQKIRELTEKSDLIVRRKKGGEIGVYTLEQHSV